MLYLYTYILNEFFFFKFLVEKSVFVGYVYMYVYRMMKRIKIYICERKDVKYCIYIYKVLSQTMKRHWRKE